MSAYADTNSDLCDAQKEENTHDTFSNKVIVNPNNPNVGSSNMRKEAPPSLETEDSPYTTKDSSLTELEKREKPVDEDKTDDAPNETASKVADVGIATENTQNGSHGDFSSAMHADNEHETHEDALFGGVESPMSHLNQTEFSVSRWGEILTADGPESKFDELHRKLNVVTEAQRQVERRRELKWRDMYKDWDKWTTKEKNHFISRVHKGIPESFRGVIWPLLSGSKARQDANPGVYDRLKQTPCVDERIILLDITRTLPNHVLFCRRDRGSDMSGSRCVPQRPTRGGSFVASSSPSRSTSNVNELSCASESQNDHVKPEHSTINCDNEFMAETKTAEAPTTPKATTCAKSPETTECLNAQSNTPVPNVNGQAASVGTPHSVSAADLAAATLGSSRSREALTRVVRAYANLDPEVGYCQGISFIAATCLLYLPEEEAFWLLETLLRDPKFNFRGLFLRDFPLVRRLTFVLEGLLSKYEPKIMQKLKQSHFTFMMLCPQWFICLYTYNFPLPISARIWDMLFCAGMFGKSIEGAIVQVPLALLRAYKDKILSATPEAVVMLLCKQLLIDPDVVGSPDVFMSRVLKSEVKTSTLAKLSKRYTEEQEKESQTAAATTTRGKKG